MSDTGLVWQDMVRIWGRTAAGSEEQVGGVGESEGLADVGEGVVGEVVVGDQVVGGVGDWLGESVMGEEVGKEGDEEGKWDGALLG